MDEIDRAQELEEYQRAEALKRALGHKARPAPTIPEPTILSISKPSERDAE